MAAAKVYPINQSPLYKLTSKRRLADVLQISLADLLFIAGLEENYREWELKQKRQEQLAGLKPPSKPRMIQQPKAVMNAVQKRLAGMLSRVAKPEFVYSATKARSYFDNADAHRSQLPAVKIDIKDFYRSVKQKAVKDFFEREMRCEPDVAHLLAKLCCVRGFLPTGGPISPVLSYFACSPMFRRIASAADESGLTFTLYVDDMVFSGKGADRDFLKKIWRDLSANKLIGHKIAYFAPNQPKIITGAAVFADRIEIPYKRQNRIRFFERAFWRTQDPDEIALLGKTLLGQYREAERVQAGSRARAKPIQERIDATRALRFADLTEVAVVKPKPRRRKVVLKRSKKLLKSLRETVSALRTERLAGVSTPTS